MVKLFTCGWPVTQRGLHSEEVGYCGLMRFAVWRLYSDERVPVGVLSVDRRTWRCGLFGV
jgi:hypothetical protein